MAIRYDENLVKNIQRVVKNFNKKIDRLEKINDELGLYILPEKVSVKALRNQFNSRKDLIKKLDDLSLYSSRGIEQTMETASGNISKYEYEILKKEQKRLKSYYTRQVNTYSKISPRIAGKKQKGTFQTLGDEYLQQLKEKREYLNKDITKLNTDDLESFKNSILKAGLIESKAITFYNNYIDEMYYKLGDSVGYDKEKLEYIQTKLKELTPQQFDKAVRVESALQTVTDNYIDIHKEETLQKNKEEIFKKYDLLYDSIDKIVEQAKTGYID